jgi:arylsulfatase A-like enzyme
MQYHPVTPGSRIGLSSREFNIAKAFAAAGYSSALVGKWHLGYSDRDFLPNAHGFEHFYGHLMAGLDYFEHRFPAGGHDWQRNGVSVHESGYSTFLLGEEAIALIRSAEKRPFFLMLSFNAPHVPIQAPEELLREYAHLEGEARRTYAAVIAAMDRTIGSVLEALDEEGISDQTIVLFLSDNGGFHRYASNVPLRGAKRSVGEGGIRVVAALRWPGVLEPGRSEQFLSHLDVLPTLLSAAGIGLPETYAGRLDGRDMWRAIRSGAQVEREPFFFGVDSSRANGDVQLAAIAGGEKLVQLRRADGSRVERLYDIVKDPGESRDLAAERPERVAELGAAIDAWRALHPAEGLRNLEPRSPLRLPDDFNILDSPEGDRREM